MKKYKIGYTQGTFDTLHHGHINLLLESKKRCKYLIVGINSDELVKEYKNTETIINENDRKKIIEAIRYVDEVVICDTLDKMPQQNKFKFDAIFIGDDWKDNIRWIKTKEDLSKVNVDVVFIPYTKEISTTIIKEKMSQKNENS